MKTLTHLPHVRHARLPIPIPVRNPAPMTAGYPIPKGGLSRLLDPMSASSPMGQGVGITGRYPEPQFDGSELIHCSAGQLI